MTIFPVWVIFSLPLDNKYNKTPFVRFVCNLTSHIYFMIIQICVACWPIYPIYRQTMMPYWIEWLLVVWLSGLLLEQLSEQQDRSGLAAIKVLNLSGIHQSGISLSHFNMIILNQYLIILYFLVGGQHFSTFHSSHIACCYSNFSCTDRMERVGLYPKSIRWSRIFDVLYSGIFHLLHIIETFSKIKKEEKYVKWIFNLLDLRFLEISPSVWAVGYYHHKSDSWYVEIYGGVIPFWSWIHHVSNGNKSTL